MRVAIIGAGITGMGAALALIDQPGVDVTVYEAQSRAGGHANTIDIRHGGRDISVDTGFIVYNEANYPEFTGMLRWLDVTTAASDMSFSLSVDDGAREWRGGAARPLNGLFATRRNILSMRHWRFLRDILAFQKQARADLAADRLGDASLGEYVERIGASAAVCEDYILPMGGAIWSMRPRDILEFPARYFLRFFENHKLLQWDRPQWRTIVGGSKVYVAAVAKRLGSRLRTDATIRRMERTDRGVRVFESDDRVSEYDAAILAVRPPGALSMLVDATPQERAILGAFRVNRNFAFLHRDAACMPRRRAAWAAWNVLQSGDDDALTITYWMNALQGIDNAAPLFVTLNPMKRPRTDLVFERVEYEHPLYDAAAIAAQAQLGDIQGRNRVWFCGAWTGYGFHEDGLRSGLAAAQALGGRAPWRAL
jgi:uncharacterized protein